MLPSPPRPHSTAMPVSLPHDASPASQALTVLLRLPPNPIHSPSAREKLPTPAKMDRRPTLPSWKKPQDFQESQDGTASHFSVSQGSVPAFEQDAIHFFKSGKGRGPRIWGCNAQAVSVRLSAAPPDPFGTMPVDHAQSLGIFRISRVVRPPVSIPKSFLIPLTSSVY